MGVEAGLRDWCRLLRRNGHVALTQLCRQKSGPSAERGGILEPGVPGHMRYLHAPESHRGVRLRDGGALSDPGVGMVGRLLPAAAGQCHRVSAASPRHPGRAGTGGSVPEGDRHLASPLRVLRLRVLRAARPLNPCRLCRLRTRPTSPCFRLGREPSTVRSGGKFEQWYPGLKNDDATGKTEQLASLITPASLVPPTSSVHFLSCQSTELQT